LFNQVEKNEMFAIAEVLEKAEFATFLPQRDGLELTRCVGRLQRLGLNVEQANRVMEKAIFALDVYQVLEGCQALVANLNGRVPDEGTVSEAAIAWAERKPIVGYKADSRTAFAGTDNPLVTGLFGFDLCASIFEIPARVRSAIEAHENGSGELAREEEKREAIAFGRTIWDAWSADRELDSVVELLAHNTHCV
jgi:nucleoside 2-deoxyribosyltransferase